MNKQCHYNLLIDSEREKGFEECARNGLDTRKIEAIYWAVNLK